MNSISRRAFVQGALLTAVASQLPTKLFAAPRRARFGLNYVPRKGWWYCWQDWDATSIREDFDAIRALHMDHIRIHCLWPMFQPGPNYVSSTMLDHLQQLLELAKAAELDVCVAVLDGWLSGMQFMPAWTGPLNNLWDRPKRNIFTDPDTIASEKQLFTAIAGRLAKHANFLGFDLGNEIGVLQGIGNPATPAQSDTWAGDMLAFCDRLAPGRFHVNGVDDSHWFGDTGFTRRNLANTGHATVLHTYAFFTEALKRGGPNGIASLHLAEYMAELANAYADDLQRPVWVQEFGASPEWMPESYIPEYAEKTIRNALTCRNLWGLTWWCSHDIDGAIKGFDSLEYTLGVLDQQNRPKPIGKKLAALATELRESSPVPIDRTTALVIPESGLSTKGWPPDWRFAEPFMKLIADGKRPVIVLQSRAGDQQYLKARGISELAQLPAIGHA